MVDHQRLGALKAKLGYWGTPSPPVDQYPVSTPRANSAFLEVLRALDPRVLIEFGSWEGRSALAWVEYARALGQELQVICVDTWLGSEEHWLDTYPGTEWSRLRLRVEEGEPHVFHTFCHSVHAHGGEGVITPLRMTAATATRVLRRLGIIADAVFVDGAHDFRSALTDLHDAKSLLHPAGVIIGDDLRWIRDAVDAFALTRHARIVVAPDNTTFVAGWEATSPILRHLIEADSWRQVRPRWQAARHWFVSQALARY